MPTYIIFSFLAATGFALSGVVSKLASKHSLSDPRKFLFYYYLTSCPFVLLFPLFFKISLPSSGWLFIFLNSLAFFLGNIFFVKAIYKLDVSTFAPFFQWQSALIAIIAFVFLGERFPLENYFYIFLMLLGSILVSLDEKMHLKTYLQIATVWIVIQQIFHALSGVFGSLAIKSVDPFSFVYWGNLVSFIFPLTISALAGPSNLKTQFVKIKPFFFSGFFSVVGATFLFVAYQTNLTISSAISLLTAPIVLIVSILLSRFRPEFLEHHTAKVYLMRALGVGIILFGALRISLGG